MLLGRSPHLCGLFDAMTARSAAARPSAAAALVHPCFEQLAAASAAEGGGGGRAKEERTCCLCLCDAPHVHAVGGGLECAAGRHFACDECLSHHVHHASVDDLRERARREGRVRCPMAPLPSSPPLCTSPRRFTRGSLTGAARVRRGLVLRRRGAGATPLGRRVRRVPLEPQAARRAAAGDRGGGAAAAGARSPQSLPCVPSPPSPTLLVARPYPKVVQHELSNLASLDASQLRVRNARLEIAELLSLKCPGCRPSTGFSVPPPRS